jgi:alpha-tubulin suppressor-like RCC1 family protein
MTITINHEYLTAGTFTVNMYNDSAQIVDLSGRNPESFSIAAGYSFDLEVYLQNNPSFVAANLNLNNFSTVLALNLSNTGILVNSLDLTKLNAPSIYDFRIDTIPSTTADFSTLGCTNLVFFSMNACPNLTSIVLGPLVTTIPYTCSVQVQNNPNLDSVTFSTTSATQTLNFKFDGNKLSQAAIDSILATWAPTTNTGGFLDLRSQNPIHGPSAAGLVDVATLQSRSWTVLYDSEPTTTTTTTTTTPAPYYFYAWGLNSSGQLGDGTVTSRAVPTQIVMTGKVFTTVGGPAGIDNDGNLWLWGVNTNGQLGTNNTINRSSPVQTVSGGITWTKVETSTTHTMATKSDGTLWIWGNGGNGQLGTDSLAHRSSPVQTVSGGTTWTTKFAIGNATSAAIKSDGSLWTWGFNSAGALGDNSVLQKQSPVQVTGGLLWADVADGSQAMCGITTTGALYSWGSNSNGGLGQNNTINRSNPTQVGTDTTWSSVAMGGTNTPGNEWALAIKKDGTLWAWGANASGQLGLSNIINRSSPVQVGTETTWTKVTAGQATSYGLKSDGTLWGWGNNGFAQVGDNSGVNSSSPVQIGNATDWGDVQASILQVACWGLKSSLIPTTTTTTPAPGLIAIFYGAQNLRSF